MTIEANVGVVDATFEVGIVLAFNIGPTDFSHSNDARECHIFALSICIEIFAPAVALHTKHILLLAHHSESVRHWVVTISFLQSCVATDSHRFHLRATLIVVEIHTIAARSHNHAVIHQCSSNTALFATPAHHSGRWSQTTFEDFVPTDDFLTLSGKIFLHTLNHIALQFFFSSVLFVGLQAKFLDALLALRA